LVIYIVDPFEDGVSLRDLCATFWAMFQQYEQACRAQSPLERRPDIALQILPMKYIASPEAPVLPSPQTLAGLAREVYDRCPPSSNADSSSLSIRTAPSFQLEESVPRNIHFKLVAEPLGDLIHDCAHLHLGYALDWEGDWLSIAWTDNCGKYQHLSSYSLRGGRTFAEAAREAWQTTLTIIQARKVTWRISIARAGVMEKDEMECESSDASVVLLLLTRRSLGVDRNNASVHTNRHRPHLYQP
jgi:mediator of RNA polymerase II transcription subunit 13, fungi type